MAIVQFFFTDPLLSSLLFIENSLFFFFNLFEGFLQTGFFVFSTKIGFLFPQNMVFIFSLKFFLCIAFLILIRGGTPRYRYDYLTKLGWLKFLSLIILVFLVSILFFFLF